MRSVGRELFIDSLEVFSDVKFNLCRSVVLWSTQLRVHVHGLAASPVTLMFM